ncbi:MAG: hypothetical protein AB7L28_03400 [Kofleriaceae bacterium]
MIRTRGAIVHALVSVGLPTVLAAAAAGCGGGTSTAPKGPTTATVKPPPVKLDPEAKRKADIAALVPPGKACLPSVLKEQPSVRLELGAVPRKDKEGVVDAVVCAIDATPGRLLGSLGCWAFDVQTNELTYRDPEPLRGHSIAVMLEDHCARGYCLPKEAKLPDDKTAYMSWGADDGQVAMLAGDEVYLFDPGAKSPASSFSIRGDKGVTSAPSGVHMINGSVLVEGHDPGSGTSVWVFKADGTAVGGIESIGTTDHKPMAAKGVAVSLLDKKRIAIADRGYSTVTTYEVGTGARGKLIRKLTKPPCKADEITAYWNDQNAAVAPKCKDHMTKHYAHLIGATAVAGQKNMLLALQGPRLGTLSVVDPKTLAEKKQLPMKWCEEGGAAEGAASAAAPAPAGAAKPGAAAKTAKAGKAKAEDPDAGGE